mmetsp:Transcript_3467/g.10637  ORF Transcript_3467/g.10637 Transcript_3467/m.10637 type:complete len:281 (-) Transcript_3467:845-1687(-)
MSARSLSQRPARTSDLPPKAGPNALASSGQWHQSILLWARRGAASRSASAYNAEQKHKRSNNRGWPRDCHNRQEQANVLQIGLGVDVRKRCVRNRHAKKFAQRSPALAGLELEKLVCGDCAAHLGQVGFVGAHARGRVVHFCLVRHVHPGHVPWRPNPLAKRAVNLVAVRVHHIREREDGAIRKPNAWRERVQEKEVALHPHRWRVTQGENHLALREALREVCRDEACREVERGIITVTDDRVHPGLCGAVVSPKVSNHGFCVQVAVDDVHVVHRKPKVG